jgi:hypothetical protein
LLIVAKDHLLIMPRFKWTVELKGSNWHRAVRHIAIFAAADIRSLRPATHSKPSNFLKPDIQRKGKAREAALFGGASLLTARLGIIFPAFSEQWKILSGNVYQPA